MTIPFEDVPGAIRVPFLYAEFNNKGAVQGPVNQKYRGLVIGPKLAAGTAPVETLVLVSSFEEAKTLFGQGSLLANMCGGFKNNNTFQEMWVMPVADNGAAVKATGAFEVTGAPTAAGTLSLYVAGKKIQVAVASGQSLASIASDVNDEIALALNADIMITSAINATPEILDFTAKNGGLPGNDIDIRVNYNSDDELPAGLGVTITPMSGGLTNPDLTAAIAALDDKQYILAMSAFSDSANRLLLEAEMSDRFGPLLQNDGYIAYFSRDTLSNQVTLGSGLNSQFSIFFDVLGPEHGAVQISKIMGEVVSAGEIDPASPFQNIEVTGLLAPEESERRPLVDRNTLLFNGIATTKQNGDKVIIERVITTYQTNAAGAADVSYLDLNTLLTLSFIRFDWRSFMLGKYPRHKLANDGTRFSTGQNIMTPKLGKAEAIARFTQWEFNGLVEGLDQFVEDLIVERDTSDVNRLNFLLRPNVINQLRVMGTQIKFLL